MKTVYCPRCEREVELAPEHLTQTIPPMIPTYSSLEFYLQVVVGHQCNEADVQTRLIADLGKIGEGHN